MAGIEKNAGVLRAMKEMEEFEKKHMVGLNRGKFFSGVPPGSTQQEEQFAEQTRQMERQMEASLALKAELDGAYAAKRAEWTAPPKVGGFVGVSGGLTPLHGAAQHGDLPVVQRLLENGQSPNEVSPAGLTPLLIAARHGQTEVVRWLVHDCKPRGDYNARDAEGNTAHILASSNGHTETLQFLIETIKKEFDFKESRRRCNFTNNQGCTPMFVAAQKGHLDTVRYLCEIEAGVNIGRDDGATPLFIASYNGHLEVVRCLVEEGRADIDLSRNDGRQPCPGNSDHSEPIRAAHRMGQFEVVRYLFGK